MKYALVDGVRQEAKKGSLGLCPGCHSDVIAKCGVQKINHWAHKGVRDCDPWWEPETEWHRTWKNNFDSDFQEVVKIDSVSGERHIADIYLPHKDLVIEFQHSPIEINEIIARESFYKQMIWVIDVPPVPKRIELFDEFFSVDVFDRMWLKNIKERRRRKIYKGGYDMNVESNILQDERRQMSQYTSMRDTWSSNPDYFLIYWIRRQKRWENLTMPHFFDIGDEYIYFNIQIFNLVSCNVVKRFLKERFIDYYKHKPL